MNKKIIQEVKEKGIFKIDNFLDNSEVSKLSLVLFLKVVR